MRTWVARVVMMVGLCCGVAVPPLAHCCRRHKRDADNRRITIMNACGGILSRGQRSSAPYRSSRRLLVPSVSVLAIPDYAKQDGQGNG